MSQHPLPQARPESSVPDACTAKQRTAAPTPRVRSEEASSSPPEGAGLSRRGFLTASAAGLGTAAVATAASGLSGCGPPPQPTPEQLPAEARSWWQPGGWFRHDTVDATRQTQGIVRARADGHWQLFRTVNLPREFLLWSLDERKKRLDKLSQGIFSTRDLAGPHNACVATYGGHPREGRISLNTAYKGMGWLPRPQVMDQILQALAEAKTPQASSREEFMAQMQGKARFLGQMYSDPGLFDLTKQGSLELFTAPRNYTHTFLNMMVNPVCSASFLAYPTFELRAIPQLLHPADPQLTDYERKVVQYINAIHNFVHGGDAVKIACIYHVIELYDDTPNPAAAGKKLA